MKTIALIPAFNEAGRVGVIIRETAQFVDAVAVIDDGSADDTSREAREAGAVVLRLPINLGYGAALETGYKYALANGFEAIVQLDADGQHDPSEIAKLIKPVADDECDLALGSRFLGGGEWKGTALRQIGMKFFGALIKMLTRRTITDPTTGFQAMNAKIAERLTTGEYPEDYPDADVLVMLIRGGYRVKEIGVVMRPSPTGKSMHSGLTPFYYVLKMLLSLFVTILKGGSKK